MELAVIIQILSEEITKEETHKQGLKKSRWGKDEPGKDVFEHGSSRVATVFLFHSANLSALNEKEFLKAICQNSRGCQIPSLKTGSKYVYLCY